MSFDCLCNTFFVGSIDRTFKMLIDNVLVGHLKSCIPHPSLNLKDGLTSDIKSDVSSHTVNCTRLYVVKNEGMQMKLHSFLKRI